LRSPPEHRFENDKGADAVTYRDADKLIEKDLASAVILQNWVENVQRTGTFSDRRPDLGKMMNCSFCERRHRMIGPRCSNADYATTQRAWSLEKGFHQVECAPRVVEQLFGKKMFRKILHKRHGQNKNNALKALTIRMQNDPELIKRALGEMNGERPHLKLTMPDIAAIPVFAKNYFIFKEDIEQRRIRRQRRVAQQVNRGTKPGGSRYNAHAARVNYSPNPSGEGSLPVRVPEQVPVSDPT
jgi:hypothetical protein